MDRSCSSASKKKVCSRLGGQNTWLHTNYNGIVFVLDEYFGSELGRWIRCCIYDIWIFTPKSSVLKHLLGGDKQLWPKILCIKKGIPEFGIWIQLKMLFIVFCVSEQLLKFGLFWVIASVSLWFYLQIGYLKKNGDGTLLFSVVNSSDPEAEGKCHNLSRKRL